MSSAPPVTHPHTAFALNDSSQVGEARRAASRLATQLGFDDVVAGRLALVVTELGTNLVKHAHGGRLLMRARTTGPSPDVEVVSLDQGPGMADVAACLRDGYSTAGSPGTGLGAVQRLADVCSVFSQAGAGTVIVARVAAGRAPRDDTSTAFEVGAVSIAAPHETLCGDGWQWHAQRHRGDLLVADGLGHGPQAAEAAGAALSLFDAQVASGPLPSPARALEQANTALRSTRGAAIAIASLDAEANTITYSGAGNITGRVVSGTDDRSLMSYHGTVGAQMRHVQDVTYPWPPHAVLVLHSDGVSARWQLPTAQGLLQCDPTVIAAWVLAQHGRGRDDATVVVVRRRAGR